MKCLTSGVMAHCHWWIGRIVRDVAARLSAKAIVDAVDRKVLLLVAEHVPDFMSLVGIGETPGDHISLSRMWRDAHVVVLSTLYVVQG